MYFDFLARILIEKGKSAVKKYYKVGFKFNLWK